MAKLPEIDYVLYLLIRKFPDLMPPVSIGSQFTPYVGIIRLDLDFDPTKKSYWIHRTPPSPEPGSMKRQF